MYMYNTLIIAINPETLQLKLQYTHIFGTGMFKNIYADYLAVPHTERMPIAL